MTGDERHCAHTLRPHGHLFRQWSLTLVAFCAPLFAVLYWLTIPNGNWLPVAIMHAVITVVWGLGGVAFCRTVIRVNSATITERPFLGRIRTTAAERITNALMLDIYESGALDTSPQLFLTDADGNVVMRMRGRYWSRRDMETVTEDLGTPVTVMTEPLTLQELNRTQPEMLYWFERRMVGRA
ncbi:MAG: hypothetical protein JWQ68_1244 [Cryobacterium sp.]|jgi:hypothetical protein|nr:hypothetical protein [Cryobacterium sp.]